MLTSLELTGFRGFHQLKLEGLQRVNLIVGKNNSGKTSLLEAIEFLGTPTRQNSPTLRFAKASQQEDEIRRWYVNESVGDTAKISAAGFGGAASVSIPAKKGSVSLHDLKHKAKSPNTMSFPQVSIPIHQKQAHELVVTLGNALKLRGAEELLETTLHQVDDRIRKLRLITDQRGTHIVLDIGLQELVPVSMVGQGVFRLLDIYGEIIGSRAKVCLVDEIENGVHHASLIDLWRGLADAAERFDVQIFATTHSHECIEAAHEAFSERPSYDLSVIQLFRKTNSVQGRVLDKAHITAAMTGEIDLRG